MSAKNLDNKNRFRSKTVGFRVSPEEWEHFETVVKLSGLSKQDYLINRISQRDIVVQGNPRVYKALRDKLSDALEDNYSRLQQRLATMYGTETTPNFHMAIVAKKLNEGLDKQLESYMKKYPNTKLIIIDTLKKIRDKENEQYSYSNDYDIVDNLKNFTDNYNICLLVVHHTGKQFAEDAFETISGSNGLLGAADGAFIMQKLKRVEGKATLDITGRDKRIRSCIYSLTKTLFCGI